MTNCVIHMALGLLIKLFHTERTTLTSSSLESTQQTADMWTFLLLIGAVSALPASVERYLGNVHGTDFYKVRVTGNMTITNVKFACENAGMRIPCYYTGNSGCGNYWSSSCVKVNSYHVSCRTLAVVSQSLCGTSEAHNCPVLDDTFVYHPSWHSDDSAWGVDFDTSQWGMQGTNYVDKYALCAVQQQYLTTWDGRMFYKVRVAGEMSNYNVERDCRHAGMSVPCWYTGQGSCTSSSYWTSHACIRFDNADVDCATTVFLSDSLCGTRHPKNCLVLDDTFVYYPYGSNSYGVNYGNGSDGSDKLDGDNLYDKYALCAATQCRSSPCVHGRCVEYPTNSVCWCDDGWKGVHCDTLIDSCASSPCLSGGTCRSEENSYNCICPPKTTGKNCEMVFFNDKCYWFSNDSLSTMEASNACDKKEGHLANVQETAQQQALTGSMTPGRQPSFWIANRISPFSCGVKDASPISATSWMYGNSDGNLDVCVLLDSTVGFLGTYQSCNQEHQYVCEANAWPCQLNECLNGGNCSWCYDDSNVFCTCPRGYTGAFCETVNWCAYDPCPDPFTCVNHSGGFYCAAPPGMKSTHSEFCTESSSCGPGLTCVEDGPAGYFCNSG